jgi:hypothetical protein
MPLRRPSTYRPRVALRLKEAVAAAAAAGEEAAVGLPAVK